jgi:RHS repeat-associated protein
LKKIEGVNDTGPATNLGKPCADLIPVPAVLAAGAVETVTFNQVEVRKWGTGNAEVITTYPHPNIRLIWTKGTAGLTSVEAQALHRDQLGSVRAVTTFKPLASGAAVSMVRREAAIYKPFGEQTEVLQATQVNPEQKGWIGERYDADAGLQFLNARYYDPELGFFLQPDWFEVTAAGVGTNRYSYSFNDPVNKMDPGGNYAADPEDAASSEDDQSKRQEKKDSVRTAQARPTGSRGVRLGTNNSPSQELLNEIELNLITRIDSIRNANGLESVSRIGPLEPRATPESIASLQSELSTTQLSINIVTGRAAEEVIQRRFGDVIVGTQVTIVTSTGLRTRADNILSGGIILEGKASSTARMSPGQTQLMEDIFNGRPVTPVGRNSANSGYAPGVPVIYNGYALTTPQICNMGPEN